MGTISYTSFSEEAQAIRHEFATEFTWISYDYASGNYIVNNEPSPSTSSTLRREYEQITTTYLFLFSPIIDDNVTPIALQRFYAHPTTLQIHFSFQPQEQATHTYQTGENNYQSVNIRDNRARSAGFQMEYSLRDNTGVLFSLHSTKNEEETDNSTTLGNRGSGENNEIQRTYGLGIVHYILPDLRLQMMYTQFESEYIGTEKTWQEDNPLLTVESGVESGTDGYSISFTGEYILSTFLGIAGQYEFLMRDGHSDVFSPLYNTIPGLSVFYDDEIEKHTFGSSFHFYFGANATFSVGGYLAQQIQERTYKTDQVVEYRWNIFNLATRMSYDVMPHIGMHLGYEFTQQDCDVVTWHPETESDPRTIFEVNADSHSVHIGITGRF